MKKIMAFFALFVTMFLFYAPAVGVEPEEFYWSDGGANFHMACESAVRTNVDKTDGFLFEDATVSVRLSLGYCNMGNFKSFRSARKRNKGPKTKEPEAIVVVHYSVMMLRVDCFWGWFIWCGGPLDGRNTQIYVLEVKKGYRTCYQSAIWPFFEKRGSRDSNFVKRLTNGAKRRCEGAL